MQTVDARGLACPLPLALAKRRMAALAAGDDLLVLSTDREAPIDLAAWALDEGHAYEHRPAGSWDEHLLRKGVARVPAGRARAAPPRAGA